MANQHKTALQELGDEYADDIMKHGIAVLPHAILWRGIFKEIPKFTRKAEARRELKAIIFASEVMLIDAQRREELKNQVALSLEGVPDGQTEKA